MTPLPHFFRRASRRMIPGDVPPDLEELLDDPVRLLGGRVREMVDEIARHEEGRAPFNRRASFNIPATPVSSRLQTDDGRGSFHLTKNRVQSRSAAEFDKYAARERAASAIDGTDAVVEPTAAVADLVPRLSTEERPSAAFDTYASGRGGEQGGTSAAVTTLSDVVEARRRQWNQVDAFERAQRLNPDGGPPRINIRYELDPELMLAIARRNDCPEGLRDTILRERHRVERGQELPNYRAGAGVPWIDLTAPATMAWIEQEAAWEPWRQANKKKQKKPFALSVGRSMQAVFAGDGEFPKELGKSARMRILKGLNNFVQAQARLGAGQSPFFVPAAFYDHDPDALNNPANNHFHFQIGCRLVQADEAGDLSFAGNKVDALTRMNWPERFRTEHARLCNIELELISADLRLDPRSYEGMGVQDATPMKKLHGGLTVLERAGVATGKGVENAAEGWRRAFARAERQDQAAGRALELAHAPRIKALAMVEDEDERARLASDLARARTNAERAQLLRHEALQIELLIAMARSRGELTTEFASGYANKARRPDGRDTYDAHGWRTREAQARDALKVLEGDLAPEREGIFDRQREAGRLDAEAARLFEAAERRMTSVRSTTPPFSSEPIERPKRHLSANAAVKLIAETPLLVSLDDGRVLVRSEDDPGNLVCDVDLQAAAARLRGVRRVQQKELGRLAAYVRRHGPGACEEAALANADTWIKATADKWRNTPAFDRLLAEARSADLLASSGVPDDVVAASGDDTPGETRPGHLPDRTMILDAANARTPRVSNLVALSVAAPEPPPAAQARALTQVPTPPVPPATELPADIWTADEHRHRADVEATTLANHERVRKARLIALEQRAGGIDGMTPLAARLLMRAHAGLALDPSAHPPSLTGETLDHRDAVEICILRHHPLFAERLERAVRGDPVLLAQAKRVLGQGGPANLLGRVPLLHERLDFTYRDQVGHGEALRTPRAWAEDSLARLRGRMPTITRDGTLFGAADDTLLRLARYNHVGLLHPAVQQQLKAEWRIQQEQEREVLSALRNGSAKLEARFVRNRATGNIMTLVRVSGAGSDVDAVMARRASDPLFYYACREAAMRVGARPAPLEERDAAERARLLAEQEGASTQVPAPAGLLAQAEADVTDKRIIQANAGTEHARHPASHAVPRPLPLEQVKAEGEPLRSATREVKEEGNATSANQGSAAVHRFIDRHEREGLAATVVDQRYAYAAAALGAVGLTQQDFDDPVVQRRMSTLHARQRSEIAKVTLIAQRRATLSSPTDTAYMRELVGRWRDHEEVRRALRIAASRRLAILKHQEEGNDAFLHEGPRAQPREISDLPSVSGVSASSAGSMIGLGPPRKQIPVFDEHGRPSEAFKRLLLRIARNRRLVTRDGRGWIVAGPEADTHTRMLLSQWTLNAKFGSLVADLVRRHDAGATSIWPEAIAEDMRGYAARAVQAGVMPNRGR